MKIFAIYFRVNLIEKPEWFEDFRKKYDDPYDLHLTLIQPRYIDESKIAELKTKVDEFIKKNKFESENKTITFNKFIYDQKPEDKYTLMLEVEKADKMINFQKKLRNDLEGFGEYTKEIAAQYEKNFRPHITFGRSVERGVFEDKRRYFNGGNAVKGIINEMVLTIVKDDSIEEAMNPKNLTVFSV